MFLLLCTEHLLYQLRQGCSYILKAESHSDVAVGSTVGYEAGMHLICLRHLHLMIAGIGVQKTQQLVTCRRIYQLVDSWQWEVILRTGLVELRKVDTHSPLPCLFLH